MCDVNIIPTNNKTDITLPLKIIDENNVSSISISLTNEEQLRVASKIADSKFRVKELTHIRKILMDMIKGKNTTEILTSDKYTRSVRDMMVIIEYMQDRINAYQRVISQRSIGIDPAIINKEDSKTSIWTNLPYNLWNDSSNHYVDCEWVDRYCTY